ncbi:FAD dependent oxidoreductase [Colletotrichum plurivorum]|uniref:FAD dependent oxidoreductase n=1 Tax=Colletotrichum plurivorum TaxID=2175906 RepID=A0A8H6JME3_9PEZI|nr:FAD dependent oxidoreductase [Colletotrichum plurivorum]
MSATSSMWQFDRRFEATSGANGAVWVHDDPDANGAGANVKPPDADIEADISKSHTWALRYAGEVARKLGVDCEYRKLPGYTISQYVRSDPKHSDDLKTIKEEVLTFQELGVDVEFKEGLQVKGWSSASRPEQRDGGGVGGVWHGQATFHPTKYVKGVLLFLLQQPNSRFFPQTRVISVDKTGVGMLGFGNKHVEVKTQQGNTVVCNNAVEAANVTALQKLSIVAEMGYNRTYCIDIRVPNDSVEDCLVYDTPEEYKYFKITERDSDCDYVILGSLHHNVGQEDAGGRFEELETWVRERFPQATTVDYRPQP